ncbi:hypothetical protein ACQVQY_32070 [Bacillus mycoides]|uniref:hypothetical protein n=1 Tax=Bacillus mycoides TaxID=1405 RepID=UPI003D64964C
MREIQKLLMPYGVDINNDMNEFLKIKEIPKEIMESIKILLIEKNVILHIQKILQ